MTHTCCLVNKDDDRQTETRSLSSSILILERTRIYGVTDTTHEHSHVCTARCYKYNIQLLIFRGLWWSPGNFNDTIHSSWRLCNNSIKILKIKKKTIFSHEKTPARRKKNMLKPLNTVYTYNIIIIIRAYIILN